MLITKARGPCEPEISACATKSENAASEAALSFDPGDEWPTGGASPPPAPANRTGRLPVTLLVRHGIRKVSYNENQYARWTTRTGKGLPWTPLAGYLAAVTHAAPHATWRATLLVALAACCFGSISTLIVIGQRHGLTLTNALSLRYLAATPFLLVLAGRGLRDLTRGRAIALFVVGGLAQVGISGLSLYSLRWIDVATLGFLFYTFPAWVVVISALRGLERVDARKLTALALALVGLVVIIGAPRPVALPTVGVALALGAALIYAAYIPLLHWMRGPLNAATTSSLVIAGAGIAFTAAALWQGTLHVDLPGTAWAVIGALALGSTVVAFITFLNGLAVLGPVRTSIISTIEPFYTAILGALALGQRVGPGTAVGGVLIAAAVLLLQRQPTPP